MFTKERYMVLIALGLLVVLFFATRVDSRTSALELTGAEGVADERLSGSDWIERHPAAPKLDVYAGSDYFERHNADTVLNNYAGSDYFERHQADPKMNVYAGSDWIERHPNDSKLDVYAGSDYFERHPNTNDYSGTNWRTIRQPGHHGR